LTNRVESARHAAFRDLTLGFQLMLKQQGIVVVGSGYKSTENGEALAGLRRTPITVEGSIEGDRLVLNFTEQGADRSSGGRFVFYLSDDGSLRGRFKSDAAQSSGSSVATRESSGRE
jgi:hypothetical protein